MPLAQKHKTAFIASYCILFYILMFHKWWNGLWMVQLKPHLFNTRFDMVTWLIMKTGLHNWLIDNSCGWMLLDVVFYAVPLLYWVTYKKSKKLGIVVAVAMLLVNWIYIECYTLYPTNSIESFTGWLLFPFLLLTTSLNGFYYVLNAIRYFFLFFFISAAVWKIVQHGFFNVHEMSGILLYQHKDYLASSQNWYTSFIYWLVDRPKVSYVLYLVATLFELSFIIGFFTKKYDRYLIILFLLFLLMDVLVMRIPYWEVAPYLLTLIFSNYKQPTFNRDHFGDDSEILHTA